MEHKSVGIRVVSGSGFSAFRQITDILDAIHPQSPATCIRMAAEAMSAAGQRPWCALARQGERVLGFVIWIHMAGDETLAIGMCVSLSYPSILQQMLAHAVSHAWNLDNCRNVIFHCDAQRCVCENGMMALDFSIAGLLHGSSTTSTKFIVSLIRATQLDVNGPSFYDSSLSTFTQTDGEYTVINRRVADVGWSNRQCAIHIGHAISGKIVKYFVCWAMIDLPLPPSSNTTSDAIYDTVALPLSDKQPKPVVVVPEFGKVSVDFIGNFGAQTIKL
jgi:hypothetical protein